MEGSEEQQHSSIKPQTQDELHQQQQLQEQGLELQSPVPPPPDTNPDPVLVLDPSPTDDGDKLKPQVVEEKADAVVKDVVDDSEQIMDEEREWLKSVGEGLYRLAVGQAVYQSPPDENLNQAVDEEAIISSHNPDTEELRPQVVVVAEALESCVLNGDGVARGDEVDRGEDVIKMPSEPQNSPVLEETEVKDDKALDSIEKQEKVNESDDGNGRNEVKDEGFGISKGQVEKRSENEDRNGNYEENWKGDENVEQNGWGEVIKDQDGMNNNYEDNSINGNEKDEDGYDAKDENDNENDGGKLGTGSADGRSRKYNYPLRPDAEDCSFYMRTGACKFGSNCKFNHPLRRKNQTTKEMVKPNEENSERPGSILCKYYMMSGGCKFGKACRYNHSRAKTAVAPIQEFNFLGLPIRVGEKECPYYMRNGSCKYGSNCRFNHPDPTAVGGNDFPSRYGNDGSVSLQGALQTTRQSWSSPKALNETAPFVPIMYTPAQGLHSPDTEWNGYQTPSSYATSDTGLPTPPAFAMNNPGADTSFYVHNQQPMLVEEFPERPGHLECCYYMKTGDCKYRSSCKFHHPKSRIRKTDALALSDKGLPLRPDQNVCSHYSRYGICKYGPGCKYDHPINYVNPTSLAGSGKDQPPPFSNSAAEGGAGDGWD